MRKHILNIALLVCIILAPMLLLSSMRVPGTNCFKVTLPAQISIYSESKLASNILADLQPNDVLYFCGDKNDN
jgi:hypothetical protein